MNNEILEKKIDLFAEFIKNQVTSWPEIFAISTTAFIIGAITGGVLTRGNPINSLAYGVGAGSIVFSTLSLQQKLGFAERAEDFCLEYSKINYDALNNTILE